MTVTCRRQPLPAQEADDAISCLAPVPGKKRRPWTQVEEGLLAEMFVAGVPMPDIAKRLGRSVKATDCYAWKIGLATDERPAGWRGSRKAAPPQRQDPPARSEPLVLMTDIATSDEVERQAKVFGMAPSLMLGLVIEAVAREELWELLLAEALGRHRAGPLFQAAE